MEMQFGHSVLCTNPKCNRIFSTQFLATNRCPYCNSPFRPYDTMCGSPIRSSCVEHMLAQSYLDQRIEKQKESIEGNSNAR